MIFIFCDLLPPYTELKHFVKEKITNPKLIKDKEIL